MIKIESYSDQNDNSKPLVSRFLLSFLIFPSFTKVTCWYSKQETVFIGFVINYFLPILINVTIPYSCSRGFFRLFVVHCVYLTNSSGPAWMNKKDSHLSSLFSSQNICHLGFLNLETMNKKTRGVWGFLKFSDII